MERNEEVEEELEWKENEWKEVDSLFVLLNESIENTERIHSNEQRR